MSIDKAIELVLKAGSLSKGGEIFILKMSALKIKDLAEAVIKEMAPCYGQDPDKIEINFTGKRDGERMYEELMNEDEAEIVYEKEDMFVLSNNIVIPAKAGIQKEIDSRFRGNDTLNGVNSGSSGKIYKSKDSEFMSVEEIRSLLKETGC
jgi:FlaA1/EpsC-like NDP-sugar epimerase